MRTAIYTRISRDRSGLSENVIVQERECRAYIEDKGWQFAGLWSDNDISVSKYSTKPRPGYADLVESVKRGQVEAVLVTEMSRLYRRLEELLDLIKLAEVTSLSRVETTDGSAYWLNTGEGIHAAIATINNAMLESRKISDRMKRKKKVAAAEGRFHGGGRPYGYEADGLTIRESEAEIIRECVRRIIAGEGLADIVRDLNQRGVTGARGGQWLLSNTWRRIYNKRNIAIREHEGKDYPAQWQPIYSIEDYHLLEAYQRAHQRSHYGKVRGPRRYVLTGFTYCACGAPMYGNAHAGPNGQPRRRYRCKEWDNAMVRVGCGKVFRLADPLEHFVREAVFHRLDNEDLASLLAARDGEADVQELIGEYEQRKRRLDALVEDYASGLLDRQQFAQAKGVAESALESSRQQLAQVQQRLTGLSISPGMTLREAWDERGVVWRHNFVKLLVEKVVVHPGHPGSHVYEGWRFDPDSVEIVWRV